MNPRTTHHISRPGFDRRILTRLCLGLLALVVMSLLGSTIIGEKGVIRHDRLRQDIATVTQLNEELQRENEKLRRETQALRTDPAYIEFVARDELGWVGPDEVVLVFDGEGPGR